VCYRLAWLTSDLVMNARAHSAALASTEANPRVEAEVSLFDRQSYCLDGQSMGRSQARFLFTQLSAFVVFFVTIGIVVLLIGRVIDLPSWCRERPGSALQVLGLVAVGAVIICVGCLGMVLWGRLLVVFGLLTKKESRGYPYSKPWERRHDLF